MIRIIKIYNITVEIQKSIIIKQKKKEEEKLLAKQKKITIKQLYPEFCKNLSNNKSNFKSYIEKTIVNENIQRNSSIVMVNNISNVNDPIIDNSTEKSLIRHKRISRVFTSYLHKQETKIQDKNDTVSKSNSNSTKILRNPEDLSITKLNDDKSKERNITISNKSLKKIGKETSLSRRIIEIRMKKWIVIILILITVNFVLDRQWLNNQFGSYKILANLIDYLSERKQITALNNLLKTLDENKQIYSFPIINITISDYALYVNEYQLNLTFRNNELAYERSIYKGYSLITYSIKTQIKYIAYIGIVRSFVVIIMIFIFFFKFKNDIKTLVIEPLDIMIKTVEKIAKDPKCANNVKELEQAILSITKKKKRRDIIQNGDIMYEIEIIRSNIIKISNIMITVIGDSGCEIIKQNLNSNQEISYNIIGKRIYGIFGFCEIRNFYEINEILQEDSIILINEIAEIVHRNVHLYGGDVSKNFGESFLVVWKIISNDVSINKKGVLIFNKESESTRFICDQALIAFLSILIEINNSPKILKYMNNKYIQSKIKNFKVRMGFGLQIGWAIEGTIGSTYKIEPSYLGPYVNMACKFIAATKIYGVSILFSDDIYELLSPELREYCRMIDRVIVKKSKKPIILYSVDVNLDLTEKKNYTDFMLEKDPKKLLLSKKENIEIGISLEGSIGKFVLNKNSFKELLTRTKSEIFYSTFLEGMNLYLGGKWNKSYNLLKLALESIENGTDGPTVTLMNYMKKFKLVAPIEWNSSRVLNSK